MEPIVEVKNLKKYFKTSYGMLHAVDDVSFTINKESTLGIVGESGCGKSTLGRTIIHLQEPTSGQVFFRGEDISKINSKKLHKLRRDMQIIFQDPYSSINPRFSVEETIQEPLILSKKYTRKQIEEETQRLMELVGIDKRLQMAYPHELDGGRRQRVGIARALAVNPQFIVCDEPVSALDVSVQAQILNLLQDLQERNHLTYMFITHDMSVVNHLSTEIAVMYLGQMVEKCETKELFEAPVHPYTQALLSAVPSIDVHKPANDRIILQGEIVSPINPKPGCRFAPRCKYATKECMEPQTLEEITQGHFVACCHAQKG